VYSCLLLRCNHRAYRPCSASARKRLRKGRERAQLRTLSKSHAQQYGTPATSDPTPEQMRCILEFRSLAPHQGMESSGAVVHVTCEQWKECKHFTVNACSGQSWRTQAEWNAGFPSTRRPYPAASAALSIGYAVEEVLFRNAFFLLLSRTYHIPATTHGLKRQQRLELV
jgi:hypothetical protein